LQKILELSNSDADISSLMLPFYVLYDLRVAYSHLGSNEGCEDKLDFINQRLGISKESCLLEIYEVIVDKLMDSYIKMSELL
jgi:hypothetical protein